MKRELKFRAWHIESVTMYWFDIMNGNRHGTGSGYISMALMGEKITRHIHKDNMIPVDPTNCDIMQYTGLLDKNGVEIYEGDIVKWYYKQFPDPIFTTVTYHTISASFDIPNASTDSNIEIIGNIYQNPELL